MFVIALEKIYYEDVLVQISFRIYKKLWVISKD